MDVPSSSQKNTSLQRIKVAVFLFAIVVALGVIGFVYFRSSYQAPVSTTEPASVTTRAAVDEPTKADFGTKAPEDFPTNIPLEAGVTMNQSYSLDYPGQKQLTAVFVSRETVKKNYDLYREFFKKEGWMISSQYESETLSSLYALKKNNEMNVTVSSSEAGTQVSVSVLKK